MSQRYQIITCTACGRPVPMHGDCDCHKPDQAGHIDASPEEIAAYVAGRADCAVCAGVGRRPFRNACGVFQLEGGPICAECKGTGKEPPACPPHWETV